MTTRIRQRLDDLLIDPQWRSRAACAGRDADMWPEARTTQETTRLVRKAIATYCHGCPVKVECAITGQGEPYGIWGGVYRHKGRVAS